MRLNKLLKINVYSLCSIAISSKWLWLWLWTTCPLTKPRKCGFQYVDGLCGSKKQRQYAMSISVLRATPQLVYESGLTWSLKFEWGKVYTKWNSLCHDITLTYQPIKELGKRNSRFNKIFTNLYLKYYHFCYFNLSILLIWVNVK